MWWHTNGMPACELDFCVSRFGRQTVFLTTYISYAQTNGLCFSYRHATSVCGELTDQVVGVVLHIVLGRSRHRMLGSPRSSRVRFSCLEVVSIVCQFWHYLISNRTWCAKWFAIFDVLNDFQRCGNRAPILRNEERN